MNQPRRLQGRKLQRVTGSTRYNPNAPANTRRREGFYLAAGDDSTIGDASPPSPKRRRGQPGRYRAVLRREAGGTRELPTGPRRSHGRHAPAGFSPAEAAASEPASGVGTGALLSPPAPSGGPPPGHVTRRARDPPRRKPWQRPVPAGAARPSFCEVRSGSGAGRENGAAVPGGLPGSLPPTRHGHPRRGSLGVLQENKWEMGQGWWWGE